MKELRNHCREVLMDQQSPAVVPAKEGTGTGRQWWGVQCRDDSRSPRCRWRCRARVPAEPGAEPSRGSRCPSSARPRRQPPLPSCQHGSRPLPHWQFLTTHRLSHLPNNSVMLNTACPGKSPKSWNQVQHRTQLRNNFVMCYLSISEHSTSTNFSVNLMFYVTWEHLKAKQLSLPV